MPETNVRPLSMLRRAALTLALAALLSACGGDDEDDGASPADGGEATAAATATPAATAAPAPTVPLGWRAFEGEVFVLALPERYIGGDPADPKTFAAMRAAGGNCVAAADLVEPQAQVFEMVVLDPDTCATAVRTLQVIVGPSDADNPTAFMDELVPGLPENAEVIAQSEGTLAGAPAALLRIRRDLGEAVTVQALYAIQSGDLWPILAAAVEETDFAAASAEFDAIAQTFRAK
jgi:hypothetical protein